MMAFHDILNAYMERLEISGKELSENAGISQAVISRYRKGERVPYVNSDQFEKLVTGLASLAELKGIPELDKKSIQNELEAVIPKEKNINISGKFDELIVSLGINVSRMAAGIHYDASLLSKIRQGKRHPSDTDRFCLKVCQYIVEHYTDDNSQKILAELTDREQNSFLDKKLAQEYLMEWFQAEVHPKSDYIRSFLDKMDEFDLNQYISAIQFDKLKVPTMPFQLPSSRHYYGLKEMREGEIDFLKAAVLSKSMEPLYLCCDMPVEDMAEDQDFAKKYMFGLAMVLKKGLHINIIHNVERPMKDMMLGLENWIPLYMTGQITPRYLKGVQNQIYNHLHYLSGTVCMSGESITGNHEHGHYYLTNNRAEVSWMRNYMTSLFQKSSPLMEIYREDRKEKLHQFLEKDSSVRGKRQRLLSLPPVFVLKEETMQEILTSKGLTESEKEQILSEYRIQKARMEEIIEKNELDDCVSIVDEDGYKTHPIGLVIPGCFLERNLLLTYDEYCICLAEARKYAEEHENYNLILEERKGYRNIQIMIHKGKWCMISKGKAPVISFMIQHPKLVYAFENLLLPIVDEQ